MAASPVLVVIQNVVKMSRKRKRPVGEKQPLTEEMIKSVFELYKPNKAQLYFLKAFGPTGGPFTGNNKRVKRISSVLSISEEEVRNLEMIHYLGWKLKSK
jgi:hypothetical protein